MKIYINASALLLVAVLLGLVPNLPRRLDVALINEPTLYTSSAGVYPVTLKLVRAENADDNGNVTVHVLVNGLEKAVLNSSYNYDTLMNKPAGSYQKAWLDNDWQRDLQVTVENGQGKASYFVSSKDGEVHPLK